MWSHSTMHSRLWQRWTPEEAGWWNCVSLAGLARRRQPEVLKVSAETVLHDWKLAKAWLLREMSVDESHDA
jgi:hypothetical protein